MVPRDSTVPSRMLQPPPKQNGCISLTGKGFCHVRCCIYRCMIKQVGSGGCNGVSSTQEAGGGGGGGGAAAEAGGEAYVDMELGVTESAIRKIRSHRQSISMPAVAVH